MFLTAACGGGGGNGGGDGGGGDGGGGGGGGGVMNEPPLPLAGCSTTPQGTVFRGFLQATDSDNNSNELTFSLDPTVPRITGPVETSKGMVELLDVTTGEFRYMPSRSGPRGADSFDFRVDDPESFSTATETVIIDPALMSLGDSITDGVLSGGTPPAPERVGYRRRLLNDLSANGFHVDFVGSRSGGQAANPPIRDPHHEGHPGFTAADIAGVDGDPDLANVYTWLTMNPADVVLLHIGTNQINRDGIDAETRAEQVGEILNEIDRWERDNATPVTVFLALIIDRSNEDGSFPNPRVDEYNQRLTNLAASRSQDDIIIVDQHDTLDTTCDDGDCDYALQPDNMQYVHPNQGGYNKLSEVWLSGLLQSEQLAKCQ
jgi:lysophospholipase L1-like esterase